MNKIYTLNLAGLIILITLLISCKTNKVTERITIKDSTAVNITWKDTIIFIPTQVAQIDGLKVYLDSLGKAQLAPTKIKSKNAFVEVAIKDNILSASGGCDSMEIVLQQKETTILNLKEILKEREKPEPYIPSIYHFFKWWSIISGSLLGLYILFKINTFIR